MNRDIELIRLLLLQLEGNTPVDLSSYSEEEKVYNSALAVEAGLIDGRLLKDVEGMPRGVIAIRLTWAGHDFLDAARNDNVWNKARSVSKSKGLSLTFDLLKDVLVAVIKSKLPQLPIG